MSVMIPNLKFLDHCHRVTFNVHKQMRVGGANSRSGRGGQYHLLLPGLQPRPFRP